MTTGSENVDTANDDGIVLREQRQTSKYNPVQLEYTDMCP